MAGWGGAVAIVGGLVGYLWLASDSIMDELKDQRPQITIKIKPKKRVVKPASREVASAALAHRIIDVPAGTRRSAASAVAQPAE